MPHMVETMFWVRERPWHGLGVGVEEAPDSEKALVLAGLDWAVEQRPVLVDGREVEDYRANVRVTDGKVLGIVGRRYRVVQNREAFSWVDELLGQGVRYETAGSLWGGRRVWLLARLEEQRTLLGDELQTYLCFCHGHDGSMGIHVAVTPVRVVCQNTLSLGLAKARRTWTAMHTENVWERMEQAREALGLARKYLEALDEFAKHLAAQPFSVAEWDQLVKALVPVPEKDQAGEQARENAQLKQHHLFRALFVPDLEPWRQTKWGALNAVVDFSQHFALRRRGAWQDSLFARTVLEGDPLVARAMELLGAN